MSARDDGAEKKIPTEAVNGGVKRGGAEWRDEEDKDCRVERRDNESLGKMRVFTKIA